MLAVELVEHAIRVSRHRWKRYVSRLGRVEDALEQTRATLDQWLPKKERIVEQVIANLVEQVKVLFGGEQASVVIRHYIRQKRYQVLTVSPLQDVVDDIAVRVCKP